MNARSWTEIQSMVIGGHLALTHLVRAGRQSAIYETRDLNANQSAAGYFVQLYRVATQADADNLMNRLAEVRFLKHPNLLPIAGIGYYEPESLVYCITEKPEALLAQLTEGGPMAVDQAEALTRDLSAGLSYLHTENLVFANLAPESVWKTNEGWKLADFSQIRLIGRADVHELRLALARKGEVPPEAYQGIVSPAWDVWSLGVLLQRVLAGEPIRPTGAPGSVPRARQLREGLPSPFQRITRECLDSDPHTRITLEAIESLLNAPAESKAEQVPELVTTPEPLRPPDVITRALNPQPAAARQPRTVKGSLFGAPQVSTAASTAPRMSWMVIFVIGVLGIGVWTMALTRKNTSAATVPSVPVTSEADRINPNAVTRPVPLPEFNSPGPTDAANIRSLLDRWVKTTRDRDINGHVNCYAPVVVTFFTKHHVSQQELYSEEEQQFRSIGSVQKFDASNVQVTQLSPTTAVILFDKNWAFGTGSNYTGSVRSQLTLHKFGNNEWKIVSERDLKVYWVRRPGKAAVGAVS